MHKNLKHLYDIAETQGLVEHGLNWYNEAHYFAQGLSHNYGLPLDTVCQVIAILSPAVSWPQNKRDAQSLLVYGESAIVSTYGRNKLKALSVLDQIEAINPKALKTYSFYQNILNPVNPEPVTIDRHAWKAYSKASTGGSIRVNVTRYRKAEKAYKVFAQKLGILPNQAQAIIWLSYRQNVLGLTNN